MVGFSASSLGLWAGLSETRFGSTNNQFNESAIRNVVVVAIASNRRLASAPGNVRCQPRETGLARESVVNVSQVLTVDKSLLTDRVGTLPARTLAEVDDGLRLVIGFETQAGTALLPSVAGFPGVAGGPEGSGVAHSKLVQGLMRSFEPAA